MILVDASIVIDYERSGDPKLLSLFKAYAAALCGITRAEVLYGVRKPTDRPRIIAALTDFIDDGLVLLGTIRFLWHQPTSPASLPAKCNDRMAGRAFFTSPARHSPGWSN